MKYDQKLIGKIIKKERERLGFTQAKLGKVLNKSEKQISKYENGALFPPIDEIARLCEIFDCDLGYLLGEDGYSEGTRTNTDIVKELGLPYEVIHKLKMISGIEPGIGPFKQYKSNEYKDIFCKVVLSKSLTYVLETMNNMKYCDDAPDREWEKINKKYGEDLMKRAEEIEHGDIDYEHDPDAPKLSKKERAAWNALKNYENYCHKRSYDNKIWRYDFSEACRTLFDEIFPETQSNKKRMD